MKIEVQYYPLENCSGNLCKIIVETTDYESAAQIVMNMFNIPRSNIYSVNSYIVSVRAELSGRRSAIKNKLQG